MEPITLSMIFAVKATEFALRYFFRDNMNIFLMGIKGSGTTSFYKRLRDKSEEDKSNNQLIYSTYNAKYFIKKVSTNGISNVCKYEKGLIIFFFDIYLYMCDSDYQKETNSRLNEINCNKNSSIQVLLMGTHINEFFDKVLNNRIWATGWLIDNCIPYAKNYFQQKKEKYEQDLADFQCGNCVSLIEKLKVLFSSLLECKEYSNLSKDIIPINTNKSNEVDSVINTIFK